MPRAPPPPVVTGHPGAAGDRARQPRAASIADEGEDFEIVKLKYADVSEIVGLLTGNQTIKSNDEFTPAGTQFRLDRRSRGGYFGSGGGLPATPILSAPNGILISSDSVGQAVDGTIGIDRRLNAIVLRGPPERVAAIKHEIELLDVPVTSVVLETEFVELSETGARNLGLDFNNANGQIGAASVSYAKGFPGLERHAASSAASPRASRSRSMPRSPRARADRLQAAHFRAERRDGEDRHRRRAADPHLDRALRRQCRPAAGRICERRRDAADRAAGQRRRVRHGARLRRRVERHRLLAGLSDDQPARGVDLRHRPRRRGVRHRRPHRREPDLQQEQDPAARRHPAARQRCSPSSTPTRPSATSTSSSRRTSSLATGRRQEADRRFSCHAALG